METNVFHYKNGFNFFPVIVSSQIKQVRMEAQLQFGSHMFLVSFQIILLKEFDKKTHILHVLPWYLKQWLSGETLLRN